MSEDDEAKLVLAKRPEDEGPHHVRYVVRAPFAWAAYWALTGLDLVLRKVSSIVWQARWHMGVVMFDRPCPRCHRSLWSGLKGCNCELVTENYQSYFVLPPEAEILDLGPGRCEIRYPVRLRRDLFHWARHHEFFHTSAIEHLLYDDRLYEALTSREKHAVLRRGS